MTETYEVKIVNLPHPAIQVSRAVFAEEVQSDSGTNWAVCIVTLQAVPSAESSALDEGQQLLIQVIISRQCPAIQVTRLVVELEVRRVGVKNWVG